MLSIVKHYFDCTDDAGQTIIIYAATLKVAWLHIPFCSFLFNDGEVTREESRLQRVQVQPSDHATIGIRALQVTGEWKADSKSITETLYRKGRKAVTWNCFQPRSKVRVRIGLQLFEGLGYAETLTLPFHPGQLPIDILLWGRYVSGGYTIIWIEWKGPYPLKKIYVNGIEQTDAKIEHDQIIFGNLGITLLFRQAHSIKNNPLSALASRYPFLKFLFSQRFLSSQEIKYSGTGVLIKNDKIIDTGRTLYETVHWKR